VKISALIFCFSFLGAFNSTAFSAFPGEIVIPVIYFFKDVKRKELHKTLKELLLKNKELPATYNKLFNASLKYMVRSGSLTTRFDENENDEILSLSKAGYMEVNDLLKLSYAANRTVLHDKIRCDILREQLNN
jgi:DNA-binding ferritin-like protein (Dps family)